MALLDHIIVRGKGNQLRGNRKAGAFTEPGELQKKA
jgi:hypothetical protein